MNDKVIQEAFERVFKKIEDKLEKIFSKSTEELIQDYIDYINKMEEYCIKNKLNRFPSVRWDKYYDKFIKIWNEFTIIQDALKEREITHEQRIKLGEYVLKIYERIPEDFQSEFLFGKEN